MQCLSTTANNAKIKDWHGIRDDNMSLLSDVEEFSLKFAWCVENSFDDKLL